MIESINVFGINFINGNFSYIWSKIEQGDLLVAPAAPALNKIFKKKCYHDALINSNHALLDSGFMVLILFILRGIKLKKLSGLQFLTSMLKMPEIKKEKSLFLVDPNNEESLLNNSLLINNDISISDDYHYVAPYYDIEHIKDEVLLKILEKKRPKYILINIGGGKQEPLGYYIKQNLSYSSTIICTGAAISFLTGKQATIPSIMDKIYLGWFVRILFKPSIYLPRYIRAFSVIKLILKAPIEIQYREN